MGPGAGGGVVEALTEFDIAGGAVLDAAVEEVGVVEPAAVVAAGVQAGEGAVWVIVKRPRFSAAAMRVAALG